MSRGILIKGGHTMCLKAGAIYAESSAGQEKLVVEQYGRGGVERRVTIDLEGFGAEEMVERIGELLRKRREHAAQLERYIKCAGMGGVAS